MRAPPIVAGLGGAYAYAQTQSAPIFTAEQAAAGKTVVSAQQCAGCHRDNLAGGGDAPPLGGKGFFGAWGSRTTADLYKFIQVSMPAGAPASLSEAQYTNVTAYLLAANGAKPGAKPFNKSVSVRISSVAEAGASAGCRRKARACETRRADAGHHPDARPAYRPVAAAFPVGSHRQRHGEELRRCDG